MPNKYLHGGIKVKQIFWHAGKYLKILGHYKLCKSIVACDPTIQ
jgi:hypothetical protein